VVEARDLLARDDGFAFEEEDPGAEQEPFGRPGHRGEGHERIERSGSTYAEARRTQATATPASAGVRPEWAVDERGIIAVARRTRMRKDGVLRES
jgi:hypothetical protein